MRRPDPGEWLLIGAAGVALAAGIYLLLTNPAPGATVPRAPNLGERSAEADRRTGTRRGGARRAVASAYGPGLYGNHLACGGRLHADTVAVAHKRLRCWTRLRVCRGRRCLRAYVRDRGPYVAGRDLDLTEAAVRRLGARSARHWGVRWVYYEEVR